MYACIYVCMHVCMHVLQLHVQTMKVCTRVYVYVRVCLCLPTSKFTSFFVCLLMHALNVHTTGRSLDAKVDRWADRQIDRWVA